jgi:hypothetical protein
MEPIDAIKQINKDFTEQNEPFDTIQFPEERLLESVPNETMEDRLCLISMFATFDYNRDANQLVDNIIELRREHGNGFFEPSILAMYSEDELSGIFKDVGFRYPNRDAKAWVKNCRILTEEYNGTWHELVLSSGCNAVALIDQLEENSFSCLKGVKIAPMYARIIGSEVCPMRNLFELDIPVDTWVRKISQEIFGEELSDDEIRDRWYFYSVQNDFARHTVDGGIWQIGNNLDGWGADYLKGVLEIDEFEYL